MKTKKLRVLLVEDSPLDAELVLTHLAQAGYELTSRRVQTAKDFEAALDQAPWDILLVDFSLPGFSATSALDFLRSTHKDLPVIIVSGTIGEERAVEVMKAGAHDYIMKDNLRRLPGAVERELREQAIRAARRKAEEELKESKTFLEKAQELGQFGSWIAGFAEPRQLFWSRETFRIFGVAPENFHGTIEDFLDRIHPEDKEMIRVASERVRSEGTPYAVEHRIVRPEGTVRWVRQRAAILKEEEGPPTRMVGVVQDITEHREAERQVRELAALLDIAQDAIITHSLEGRVQFWSRGAEKLYGFTAAEASGRPLTDLIFAEPQSFLEAMEALPRQGRWEGEVQQITKGGNEVITLTRCCVVSNSERDYLILSVSTDLTETKRLEKQFLRAQRLESIGALASGIAHDINNVLAPILMTLQLFRPKLMDAEDQELLDNLEASANRGAEIVRQVLAFSRGEERQRARYQLKRLILDVTRLLKQTLPEQIQTHASVPVSLREVVCDPSQMYQVLMSICMSIRDAVPAGGALRISAEEISLDPNAQQVHPEAREGSYVQLSISAQGLEVDAAASVFTPFFPARGSAGASGQRIMSTLGIVRRHGGFMTMAGENGSVETVRIYLPLDDLPGDRLLQPVVDSLPRGKGERILFVDDEATIRIVTKATLEDHGYRVLLAADGTEALALFAQEKGFIDLVLTDMVMPYLDGPSTIRAIQKIDPNVPIIAITNGQEQTKGVEVDENLSITILSKPFSTQMLLETLGRVLAEAGARP